MPKAPHYECFEFSVHGGIAHLKMSRPERRNAMTVAFWKELPEIVRGLEARALVISSSGPHFTAGMDVSIFASSTLGTGSVAERRVFRAKLEELQETFNALADAPFPVIAAVQGGCIGGGVDLATACCLRYATRDHSVAESFDYLNALQPAIFDLEEIKRALANAKRG